jgi:uncharacterized protein YdhG (YjbR/CyaY superfamily)
MINITGGNNMEKPRTIDEYMKAYPEDIQIILEQIRSTIKQHVPPETVEKISYGMPTFYLRKNLVHFAAFKNHIGFYPTPSGLNAFRKEIAGYKHSKGAVQFPLDKPVPLDLISRIVKYRVNENL